MSKPKLTVRTGDTLAAVARLSGSENHKGYNIIHADGYVVAYVTPIDEDGVAGGELARQFAAAPDLLAALERIKDRLAPLAVAGGSSSLDDSYDTALAAIAKARGEVEATPHFPNEHGDCPSWCPGCQHDPPQQCFFPRCHCASPSLGDCKGQQSAPEVEEAAKLRDEAKRLRVALERLYKQAAAHWASMSMAAELDAARLVLAGEQLPDAATEARSDWHHGYPAGALLRLVAYALRECGYEHCRALVDDIERFADNLHPSSYDSVVELSGALLVMLRQLGGLTMRADYLLCRLAAQQPDWIEPLKRRKHWLKSALAGAEEVQP